MFSFRSFIVSGFAFRSLIHFKFIFVYGIRECSNFVLLHVALGARRDWEKATGRPLREGNI